MKSGLFAHFDSKQNLQLEVLKTSVNRFIASVVVPALEQPRGIPRIEALFDNWIACSRDPSLPGGCFFIAAANELDDRPGPLREKLVAYQQDWFDALATAGRIAVEEGQFRKDVDVKQFAYDFYSIALVHHHFSRLLKDPEAEHARARVSHGSSKPLALRKEPNHEDEARRWVRSSSRSAPRVSVSSRSTLPVTGAPADGSHRRSR